MIRPWYRSRLFWLGIPGLLFLLWVWWQSNLHCVELYWGPGWICSGQGELLWHDSALPLDLAMLDTSKSGSTRIDYSDGSYEKFGTLTYGVTPPPARGDVTIRPVDAGESHWFPPLRWRMQQDPNGQDFHLRSVPYWLLTGGYAGVWLGGLAGWQRRKGPPHENRPAAMIRPWYHSPLFWLGLPGLLFSFWIWFDSSTRLTSLSYVHPASSTVFAVWKGGLTLGHAGLNHKRDFASFWLNDGTFRLHQIPARFPGTDGWKLSSSRIVAPDTPNQGHHLIFRTASLPSGSSMWSLYLPHWLLIASYMSMWLGCIVWWQRRKARLLKLHVVQPP